MNNILNQKSYYVLQNLYLHVSHPQHYNCDQKSLFHFQDFDEKVTNRLLVQCLLIKALNKLIITKVLLN